MHPSSQPVRQRSAAELRLVFETMTAHPLPRVLVLEKFDVLWDEVNRSATFAMSSTRALPDYIVLLKDMQDWYKDVLHGPDCGV